MLKDAEFDLYRSLIYRESGIHFSSSNRSILESRLRERLKAARLETADEYYRLILSNGEELKILLDSVTTNLTRFFRNMAHFETLEHFVIPDLLGRKRNTGESKVRIWCAGCSTGEEPYTVAMVMKEVLPADMKVEVVGSDISLKSLMIGKEGYYPGGKMTTIPENYLARYFQKTGDGYQVRDDIRALVKFDYHNLVNDSGLRDLDIVFCRNVLIYFDQPAQEAAVRRFWETMGKRSYLFIGHSESLFGMNTSFEFVKTDWACIYRKSVP